MNPQSKLARLLAVAMLAASAQVMAAAARLSQSESWTAADANGDGALSRDEARRLPRLARVFDAIDGNRDGVISGAEVRAWREARRALKPVSASKGVEAILRGADRDGDGALSRAEFKQGLPRFAQRFDLIDTDRDASLSRVELGRWLATLRGARRSRAPHQ